MSGSVPNPPCRLCNNLQRRILSGQIPQYRAAFDFSPTSLAESSGSCPFCAIILSGIRQFEPHICDTVVWIYARGPAEVPPQTLSLELYFRDSRPKLELELHAQTEYGALATQNTIRLRKEAFHPLHPLSPTSLAWTQSHISSCLHHHAKCPPSSSSSSSSSSPLPPRVLHLTATNPSDPSSLRVTLVETHRQPGRYACLSHRWGTTDLGIATRENYPSLLGQEIPWDSLPRTFREAGLFVFALGITNLWIDSLCIIQDDPQDWREQAGLMAGIYEGSFVTIAATSSVGGEAGCFWEAEGESTSEDEEGKGMGKKREGFERPFTCDTDTPNGRELRFTARKTIKHWERLWKSTSAAVFPLLTRAWVFQERLLAPRVVHFSQCELVWECREVGDCQCKGYTAGANPKRENWGREEAWSKAVELFTSLRLTREEDRLPALLGFADFYAREMGLVMTEEYVAGLWKRSLQLNLIWRIDAGSLAPETGDRRICRCFDVNTSETGGDSFRCQYSYSAACSPSCLETRKLCRFGEPSAAVSRGAQFAGSCPGQETMLSSIQGLREHYQTLNLDFQDQQRRPKPSWSWVSAKTGVLYWPEIRYTPRPPERPTNYLSPCEVRHVQVDRDGHQHLAEPIRNATLTVDGQMACGYLQYRYQPDPDNSGVQHHSIFRYGLVFGGGTDNRPLEWYPDYVLCFEGDGWMPPGTPLFLLHVVSGIHLVLQEKKYFSLEIKARFAKALQRQSVQAVLGRLRYDDPEMKYVRVGVLRSPRVSEDVTYWPTRWMFGVSLE